MTVAQYRPAYFEGFGSQTRSASTTDELLAIPFVKNFSEQKGFSGYARSGNHLMALFDEGYKWWVVALLTDEDGDSISLEEHITRYREQF